jgi:hypothetical protein
MKMYFKTLTGLTNVVGGIMGVVFTIEMVLKVLACGDKPWEYLYNHGQIEGWNLLDFIVVLCNYIPNTNQDLLMVLRMTAVFKLMKMHPKVSIYACRVCGCGCVCVCGWVCVGGWVCV